MDRIRRDVIKINRRSLDQGLSLDEILDFWEECHSEALIQHNLPPCKCRDVNQCETWCQAKARFGINPPEN